MAQEYFTLITLLGQAKIAAAIANSTSVNISEIAVGDGAYTPTEGQTALVSEQYRAAANTIERETDDPSIVRLELVIPSEIGGFIIREFGVFDSDGDLFAVGNLGDTYKPTFEQGSGKEIVIRIRLQISSQANVTLQIDPAVVMASREYVDTELAGHKDADPAHPAAKISYDNTTSGLEADDVQVAIDEVNAAIEAGLAALAGRQVVVAIVKETFSQGTGGGSATDGATQTRKFNFIDSDPGGIVSLQNFRIVLQPGIYLLRGRAAAYSGPVAGHHYVRFFNYTAGSDLGQSGGIIKRNGSGENGEAEVSVPVSLSEPSEIELRHVTYFSFATNGLGWPADETGLTECFAMAEIIKLGD